MKENFTIKGTPAYIAPEYMQSHSPLWQCTSKCDIFSFGVLCYAALIGTFPWLADDTFKQAKLQFPTDCALSQECIHFIQQCLEKDPQKRPSASELLEHDWFTSETPKTPSQQWSFTDVEKQFEKPEDEDFVEDD